MACCTFAARVLRRFPALSVQLRPSPAVIFKARSLVYYIVTSTQYVCGSYCGDLHPKKCTLSQNKNLRQLSTVDDFLTSNYTDTRQYLLSIQVNCQMVAKTRPSIFNESKDKVEELVTLLETFDFPMEEVANAIEKNPLLLMEDSYEMRKRLELLQDLGLNAEDIVNIVKLNRFVLTTKVGIIVSHIQTMHDSLGASTEWMCSMIRFKPLVFIAPDPDVIRVNILMIEDLLLQHGNANPKKVLRQMMRNDHRLFNISKEQIMATVEFLADKGITGNRLVRIISKCPNIFQSKPEDVEERLENLKNKLSLSESDLLQFVLHFPRALGMHHKNLNKHFDFLFERGFTSSHLVQNPYVFWRSIDTLERRYKEQQDLDLFSTPERVRSSLVRMIISEADFRTQMDKIIAGKKANKNTKKVE